MWIFQASLKTFYGSIRDNLVLRRSASMSTSGIRAQLLQSQDEWAARTAILSRQMADLIDHYSAPGATDGMEVGCQQGARPSGWSG
jgi:hypothetical protein